jgi:hypothetical protein
LRARLGPQDDGRVTWTAPQIDRHDPPTVAGERQSLDSWLDFHRATLLFKCQGLTGEQLTRRAVEPSSLSLLGLVRHMAEVERSWFRHRFAGQAELDQLYCSEQYPDGDFDLAEPGELLPGQALALEQQGRAVVVQPAVQRMALPGDRRGIVAVDLRRGPCHPVIVLRVPARPQPIS